MYEYYMLKEHKAYQKELDEDAADKIEERKIQQDQEWADMMEEEDVAKEEPVEKNKKPEDEKKEEYDPLKDPKNVEWMEQQIQDAKLFFDDESFGEDVSLNFDDPNKD